MFEEKYVNVEQSRYEDLIVGEENLRALEEIIYKFVEYSECRKDLRISDDRSILVYLSTIDIDYEKVLKFKKEEYENKYKGDE